MAEVKWTAEQLSAIETRNKELLLSAAAGSGKTAVLTERIAGIITDRKNYVSPKELLVLTFSKAAANEMKQRIIKRVAKEEKNIRNNTNIADKDKELEFLRQQKRLLNHAQISTIHVFCKDLISENFSTLNISPDFRVADEKESKVLFDECLTNLIEENYEKENNQEFLNIVELISKGRDDTSLKSALSDIYDNMRSYPFYLNWMKKSIDNFNVSKNEDFGKTPWAEIIFNYTKKQADYIEGVINQAISVIDNTAFSPVPDSSDKKVNEQQEKFYKKKSEILSLFQNDLSLCQIIQEFSTERDWEKANASMLKEEKHDFGRWPVSKGLSDEIVESFNLAKDLHDSEKTMLKKLIEKNYFCSLDIFKMDNEYNKNLMTEIFKLIRELDEKYSEEKSKKKMLDFSDLEHNALRLLVIYDEDGTHPTEIAEKLSERYKEILVDEYQDTNYIQEEIFRSISKNGKNMFMVGDVKQSIYSFRQARPELFLEKKNNYPELDKLALTQDRAKIILAKNFRSCHEVTEGINFIFNRIMTDDIGGLSYGKEDSLIHNDSRTTDDPERGCEFDILDFSKKKSEENFDKKEAEAQYVATRIKELVSSGFKIKDGDEERPIRFSDIAILMRSARGRAEVFQKVLTENDIPAIYNSDSCFLNSLEIKAVTSLLKALDNPLLDDELYNAVMSPLFNFTVSDMARLSLNQTNKHLFFRISESMDKIEKCKNFMDNFNYLRKCAMSMSVADLILEIYDLTGFETVVQANPNGKIAALNLKLLVNYAGESNFSGYSGLSGFIRYINKLDEVNGDLQSAQINSKTENTVQIMTIHASKGLEFPAVFLVDTSSKFNKMDLTADIIIHHKLGFATVRRDNKLGAKYNTVHNNALKILKEEDLLSEEMRILYVALTRAKEKLIMVGSFTGSFDTMVNKLTANLNSNKKIEWAILSSCQNYMEWILAALLHHKNYYSDSNLPLEIDIVKNCGNFSINYEKFEINDIKKAETEEEIEEVAEIDKEILAELENRRNFVYEDKQKTITPTKFAISSIGKSENDFTYMKKPKFMKDEEMTGAEKGTALHKFMQFADFSKLKNGSIEDEIERLTIMEYLSISEGAAVLEKISQIEGFISSNIFARIKKADSMGNMYREYDFIAEVGNDILGEYTDQICDGCKVTVQGIADCIIIEDGIATVIDYKTDNVKSEEELLERYSIQLSLYKKLLKESLGCEIKNAVIYSFKLSKEIEI